MRFLSRVRFLAAALAVAAVCSASNLMAQNAPALPHTDFDIDIAGYVPPVLAFLATTIAAVVGGYFLIQLVRGGMMWVRRYATK